MIKSRVQCRPMQSLDIKRPAKQSNQAKASAILINYPAVTAAATAIPSGYFAPTVSTNYSVSTVLSYCARSVPLLDLLDLLCRLTVPTDLF